MSERFDVDGVAVSGDHFIGGERVSSKDTFETRSPMNWERVIGNVARGDAETADQAVAAATDAFPGWAALTPAERGALLHKLADLIEEHKEDIANVECTDMAMLFESLKLRLVPRGALNFRNYADIAADHEERVWSSKGTLNRVVRMPAGPAVIITPWNAP